MDNYIKVRMPELHTLLSRQEILELAEGSLQGLLSQMHEGVQLWYDAKLLFANQVAARHFGCVAGDEFDAEAWILARCSDQDRKPLPREGFPVFQVLQSAEPCGQATLWMEFEQPICLRVSAYPLVTEDGSLAGVLSISHDITDLIEEGRRLETAAYYDSLTGLPNRLLLTDRLQVAMANSRRSGQSMALCMLDLDGFKQVNDSLGHVAGDQLLKEVSRRLLEVLREVDTAARLGGDEFVVLICNLNIDRNGLVVINRILQAINAPYTIKGERVRVSASIGVTLYPSDNVVADKLLCHADHAMYQAKAEGKNRYHIFDPTLESRRRANRAMIERIGDAISKDQFILCYQPIVDCAQEKVVGVEALIRWQHPVLGLRSPAEFIPLIENEDMIADLGEWVIDKVLRQMMVWREQGLDLKVSINIAPHQLLRGDFSERMTQLLAGFPDELVTRLEFELLETAALEDVKAIGSLIEEQQARGLSFALDDFGTGFSSLGHLKHLRANCLKIDRGLVQDMINDPGDLVVVQGIIGLGKAFRSEVVAEGVETAEQILILMELGCRVMQGYCIAPPMPAAKISGWVDGFIPDPRWRVAYSEFSRRSDFDLLLMEVSHRQWLAQLQSSLKKPPGKRDRQHKFWDESLITNWFDEIGEAGHGQLEGMHDVEVHHRDLHRIAEVLWQLDAERQPVEFTALEADLADVSERLLGALHTVRKAMKTA
jgi:diguanylate cyclase (GGDEF)-like protein